LTAIETRDALKGIVTVKQDTVLAKMQTLDKTQKTERKALSMTAQVMKNCVSFCEADFKDNVYTREVRTFGREFHDFDAYKDIYATLVGDDRESFLEFSFAVIMTRHAYYTMHKDKLADAALTAEKRFESELIVSVIDDILRSWQRWWNENGCVKCEVIEL